MYGYVHTYSYIYMYMHIYIDIYIAMCLVVSYLCMYIAKKIVLVNVYILFLFCVTGWSAYGSLRSAWHVRHQQADAQQADLALVPQQRPQALRLH